MTRRMAALLLALAFLLSGCAAGKRTAAPKSESAPSQAGERTAATEQAGEKATATGQAGKPAEAPAPSSQQSAPGSAGTSAASSAPAAADRQRMGLQAEAKTAAPAGSPMSVPQVGPPPGDMYFQDYGENPMVSTSKRPVSTFSVDVDTASIALARSYLDRGLLPPPESIRVEEFVNYFPQGYPRSNEDLAVHIEGAPSPFRPGYHLIEIGLQGRHVAESQRKPAVLTFVVDVSGSMNQENRLGLVKRSLSLLLDQLQADDQVGLVIYASKAEVVLEPTSDKEAIRRAIDRLQPGGSTYAEEGIRLGYELAYRHYQEGAINRVILCSDGVANVGKTGPEEILRTVEDYRTKGITLTTVGFGMGNYNDVLMERLADKGDGQYAYVGDIDEARRIFGEQLTSTLQVVAKDAKVQVSFDPEQVLSYRLVGYENRAMANQDFRNDRADAGEVGAGQSVTALYEVQLTGSGPVLGSVSIRYKEPESGEVTEKTVAIRRSAIFSSPSAHLLWTASVAEFAGLLSRSSWASETAIETVRKTALRAAADLEMQERHRSLLRMMDQAVELGLGQ